MTLLVYTSSDEVRETMQAFIAEVAKRLSGGTKPSIRATNSIDL